MSEHFTSICQCCGSNNVVVAYETSFFNLPVLKCDNCSGYFLQYDKGQFDIKKYYNETYWAVFRNIHDKKITDQQVDKRFFIKKLPKILRDLIEITGVRKAMAYSQYNYVKPHINGKLLFELGSGEGFVLELFEKRGFDVYGMEPSRDNLEIINKKLKKGKCEVGFAENINDDIKFDVVMMSHVLEHIVNCKEVLSNLKNIISDKGILFIEVPDCENVTILEQSVKEQPHIHHFTKRSLQTLLENLGFKILRIDVFDSSINSMFDRFKYFVFWILKRDYYTISAAREGTELRVIVSPQK